MDDTVPVKVCGIGVIVAFPAVGEGVVWKERVAVPEDKGVLEGSKLKVLLPLPPVTEAENIVLPVGVTL